MGPTGAALETHILDYWRRHFVLEDAMLEVRTCQLTPYPILAASGHVERFSDLMVKDVVTGESFRCDHLIKGTENFLISAFFENVLKDSKLNDSCKNKYMAILNRFLRPETAQGIFVNFKRLLEFNNNRMPFAATQIGFSFRNEISPRSGLLRCREFLMAEIEHFIHPAKKFHPKFKNVANIALKLFSASDQLNNLTPCTTTLQTAVDNKIIANDVLAYYIGRVFLFLQKIGIDLERVRFRQHLPQEMAHYACDCWDCEIHAYHGWVECIGLADRACYDLSQHSKESGSKLVAYEQLLKPDVIHTHEIVLDKAAIGKQFGSDSKQIFSHLESLSNEQAIELETNLKNNNEFHLTVDGKIFTIINQMVKKVIFSNKEVFVKEYYPHVIEPSFGIGRILYSLLAHSCMVREQDEQRIWFKFDPIVAPTTCVVLPLSNKEEFQPYVQSVVEKLARHSIPYKVDDLTASIGKRYARGDELGTPFAITVDFDTLTSNPATVTLRERNTTEQIRLRIQDIAQVIKDLIDQNHKWIEIVEK
ncbi:hypothetical protein MXB_802, partial [Myxobolus squamalis]